MDYNIYRLTGGLKPISWQLPLKEVFIKKIVEENNVKKDLGYRRIKYVPGTDTIFAEDIKGDLKPESIWFNNGQLRVRKDDLLKNKILTQHPWFNRRYEVWSQEGEDRSNLELLRLKSSARQLIDDADFDKVKAIALAVFGMEAANWSEETSELKLREYADNMPKQLKEVMEERDYESRLLAALAFTKGIVKENLTRTAVVWQDSEGEILKLAKGERGVLELGRYLSDVTTESEMVLQSLGERIEALDTSSKGEDPNVLLSQKDKEIAELKKLLAQQNKTSVNSDVSDGGDNELSEARKKYSDKFKKKVPVNKKNDLEWITNRLAE